MTATVPDSATELRDPASPIRVAVVGYGTRGVGHMDALR